MDYIYSEIDPQIAIDANQLLPQADEADIGKVVTVTGKNQYGLEESTGLEPLIGTTETVTPTQIAAALQEGRDICVTGTVNYLGFDTSIDFTAWESASFEVEGQQYTWVISNAISTLGDDDTIFVLTGELQGDSYEPISELKVLTSSDIPNWNTLKGKPFETLGSGLSVNSEGVLSATGGGSSFSAPWYIKSWNNPDDDSYVYDFYIKYGGTVTSIGNVAHYMGQDFARIYFVDDEILNKISIDNIPMLALDSNLTTGRFLYPDLRITESFYGQGFHDVSLLGLTSEEIVESSEFGNLSADTPIHIFLAYKSGNDIYGVLPKSIYDNLVYVQPSDYTEVM